MTDNSSLIARQSPAALYLFLDAMRCWGVARRAGQPTLVRLHARLGRHGWAQLLPAIDSLLDLSEKVCRWPMGHPGEPDFHFCGEAVNPGFPYCVEHCGRAYQAQLPRGSRRPPPPLPYGGPRVR